MTINKRIQSDLILLLVAVVWGSAFTAQRVAAVHLGPFIFNGSRFLLGALIMAPLALKSKEKFHFKHSAWVIAAGMFLFIASVLQQAGLKYTTAGNAGFITGLYVVFVPLILFLRWRTRLSWNAWTAVLLAAVGLYFLSVQEKMVLAPGDGLELAGAVFWAMHVILVSRIIGKMNILHFALGQYLVCGILNMIFGLLLESHTFPGFAVAYWTVIYTGVMSVGLGYTLQVVGQRHSPPVDAAVILSMEAVFAALFGFIFLGELLSLKQILGSIMIFTGIIIAQFRIKPS